MKYPSQDSEFLGQHLSPGPPKYESGMITTQPKCSVHNRPHINDPH